MRGFIPQPNADMELPNFGESIKDTNYVHKLHHHRIDKEMTGKKLPRTFFNEYNHFENINNVIFIRGWSKYCKDFDYINDPYSRIAAIYIPIHFAINKETIYDWAVLKLVDEQDSPFMSYGYFTDNQLFNFRHLHTIGMNYIFEANPFCT